MIIISKILSTSNATTMLEKALTDTNLILGIAAVAFGLIAGYTGIIFKIGSFNATLNKNSALIIDVHNIIVGQDDAIKNLEKVKVDKEEFEKLLNEHNEMKESFIRMQEQHKMNHKE